MSVSPLSPRQRIGAYVLLEKLGEGGLGEVWKARDPRLNRVVALKFLAPERSEASSPHDLLHEARAASALNHPNIITIFEVGESEGRPFLAMEFVEGETLRARLKRPPLLLPEALDVAQQVVEGLAVAHRIGVVHRDLKPENVFLRVDGYVKLLDFGLAKVLPWGQGPTADFSPSNGLTESGAILGTLTYMSPEQARGLAITPASDVFSFGIVLYEMLVGEHPFQTGSAMDTVSAILSREVPRPQARAPAVPQAISEVCCRALEKDLSKRYASALELRDDWKRALAAPSSSASPPSVQPSFERPKPRWMQAVGAVLISFLLGLAGWRYAHSPSSGESTARVNSVAVMSFRAASDDPGAVTLAQDLPEELSSALASTGLRVVSRSSVLELGAATHYRQRGAELGVDAILEGSVRSYVTKFKVYVELVDTRTGFQGGWRRRAAVRHVCGSRTWKSHLACLPRFPASD